MNRRIGRAVSGVLAGVGLAVVAVGVSAAVAAAEPVPTPTPAPGSSATSTVDELTDMVLDALEDAKQGQ
ncbi:hypothetical protein [Mycolicibacterium smegmatis]|nr:hypothetical protein [Mycolicibacterium smegmatis]ABK73000.1 hypothetical protein MSMEG_5480 [Mycolicibacterium smegmatis MC2 155]AIU10499.1 hypothetical protein LJ00_27090 [Mycolicibacterium smegmatis MC2 155]AIU17124.1 hypothetical protein LI99_27095 [Mycolicibacterium smegmatis]AIU23747.1 hypothetical protein LI98_27100 [Mycolicibacterium smegmatis]AWT56311.1 hypothetical protein D806_053640 [Mycolicibacterium smegmatis MKD8]